MVRSPDNPWATPSPLSTASKVWKQPPFSLHALSRQCFRAVHVTEIRTSTHRSNRSRSGHRQTRKRSPAPDFAILKTLGSPSADVNQKNRTYKEEKELSRYVERSRSFLGTEMKYEKKTEKKRNTHKHFKRKMETYKKKEKRFFHCFIALIDALRSAPFSQQRYDCERTVPAIKYFLSPASVTIILTVYVYRAPAC